MNILLFTKILKHNSKMNIRNKLFYKLLNFPLYKKFFINKYTKTFEKIFSMFLFTKIT